MKRDSVTLTNFSRYSCMASATRVGWCKGTTASGTCFMEATDHMNEGHACHLAEHGIVDGSLAQQVHQHQGVPQRQLGVAPHGVQQIKVVVAES